jgi:hypothetical protein
MEQLDYTFNPETDMIQNPMPILQQQKAELTTNPFIKPARQEASRDIDASRDQEAPQIKINRQLSIHLIGFMDDLLDKPDDMEWHRHVKMCLHKDDRMLYLTILLVFIVLFMILIF